MTEPTPGLVPAEHERDLAATVRRLMADLLAPAALRAAIDTHEGYSANVWKAVANEIGLCGLTVPEQWGGLGLGWCELNTVHVELGRALFPGPFLATSLATTALVDGDDVAAQERWLPSIASGDIVATVAVADRAGSWTGEGVAAHPGAAGWRLSGTRHFVPAGHVADLLVVAAQTAAGTSLFAVDRGGSGVHTRAMEGLDLTRRLATVELSDAPAVLLGADGGADRTLAAMGRHLRIAVAAEAAGGLAWCLDTIVAHVLTREQFGRPIGGFQAVAHGCVDLLSARQSSTAVARWAAHAAATGSAESLIAGHVAALRTGEAYRDQTEATIHLLGGVGFTWEHDAHLYYRRARSALALSGGVVFHREAIARATGLGGVSPK